MRATTILMVACGLAATAPAQGFTSPAGYPTTEGSSNHDYILFKYDGMRWQQLDDTSIGQAPMLAQQISWRRDGTAAADPSWVARTMDVEVVLSNSVPAGLVSLDFDSNYTTMTSTVFTMKPVVFPDWTRTPATTPAPFDLVLQLDSPWPYLGTDPFLWEVRTRNNTSASDYGNDFQSVSGSTPTTNTGTALGVGCTVGGQTGPMALPSTFTSQVSQLRISYDLTQGPIGAPVFANIDLTNSNLSVPGLCTPVIAAPTIPFGLGMTDPTGSIALTLTGIDTSANLIGRPIYTQTIGFDGTQPGLPFALSNAVQNTFPSPPSAPASVTRLYEYCLASGAMRAPSYWTGGIVTRFD